MSRITKIASLLTAAAAITLAGCGTAPYHPNGAYGPTLENAFLSSCELRNPVPFCMCALGYMEQNIPVQQSITDGNNINAYGQSAIPAYVKDASAACQFAY